MYYLDLNSSTKAIGSPSHRYPTHAIFPLFFPFLVSLWKKLKFPCTKFAIFWVKIFQNFQILYVATGTGNGNESASDPFFVFELGNPLKLCETIHDHDLT